VKFAFISTMHGASWGGSEELWSQTASRLKREGHDVLASVAYWLEDSKPMKELARIGVQLESHAHHQGSRVQRVRERLLWGGLKINARLKQFKPDLAVISQGENAGGFAWGQFFRAMSVPYVVIAQCNCDQWWFGEQTQEAIDYYCASRKTFCVADSNLELLRLQLGEILPNAEVVWNPFSVSADSGSPWPEGKTTWNVTCPARLHLSSKGQDLLLRTLAGPQWRDRPLELNLFGNGPDKLVLQKMVTALRLKNVHFRGHVPDMSLIWDHNHLLVLPSRYEGLPIILVDAMWSGRPAVVTDVGDNAKMCVDGETGFVASSPTVASVSEAMERAWMQRNAWKQMGHAARRKAESEIPRDPIAVFCEKLKCACDVASSFSVRSASSRPSSSLTSSQETSS
jgi:glycosyltransferase involved in cell wall biosynthesis